MEFWAELKSKKELEEDFHLIVKAFIALAEELIEEEERQEQLKQAESEKRSSTNHQTDGNKIDAI